MPRNDGRAVLLRCACLALMLLPLAFDASARRRLYGTSKAMTKAQIAGINRGLVAAVAGDARFDTPPELIEGYMPIYPISRLLDRRRGLCRIQFGIGANGQVLDPHRLADDAADEKMCTHSIIAMRAWRFRPATKSGEPVDVPDIGSIPFDYSTN